MNRMCPRCGHQIRPSALFCGGCGLALTLDEPGADSAVLLPHPTPLAAPPGFTPCENAPQLCYQVRHAWGGEPLLSIEPCVLHVFNTGYDLRDLKFHIAGVNADGGEAFVIEREIEMLPRGHEATLELSSWELSPAERLTVRLAGASFAPAE